MNPGLDNLQPYPFERLRKLTANLQAANLSPIALTIGEPKHAAPEFVLDVMREALSSINQYPATAGSPALRETISLWLKQRFNLQGISPEQILPVNGTREALFAIAQTLVTPGSPGRVICPNPFYQIYEGAALLAGSQPTFVAAGADTGFLPDFGSLTSEQWDQCELLYICTPGNPSGAVMPLEDLQTLLKLAEEHDFVIVSDECYSEIYADEAAPPAGLLQAAAAMGNHDYTRCLAFHSLSKRSNLPGLRSGFVAGDADVLAAFLRYRTYHGCAMPPHHQAASIAAWQDEEHVYANRALYREKFEAVVPLLNPVLPVERPAAGFYLWPSTPISDESFAVELVTHCNVAVLPGQYLGRAVNGINPGANHVRMALVAELAQCVEAAERIVHHLKTG